VTVRIVTNSTCDLPAEVTAESKIAVVPLYVNFGAERRASAWSMRMRLTAWTCCVVGWSRGCRVCRSGWWARLHRSSAPMSGPARSGSCASRRPRLGSRGA